MPNQLTSKQAQELAQSSCRALETKPPEPPVRTDTLEAALDSLPSSGEVYLSRNKYSINTITPWRAVFNLKDGNRETKIGCNGATAKEALHALITEVNKPIL